MMSAPGEATLPATRRIRKSIGTHADSRKAADKENATVDLGSTAASRMSRSKSLGPGGLDALKQGNGNRRASLAVPSKPPRSILKSSVSALPEIPPMKKKTGDAASKRKSSSSSTQDDSNGSKIALRTEEEQQAAAREREERERKDARRKSLANRRVSFAAEATLHTFHEVEFPQDSTTSTDSTRRASAGGRRSINSYENDLTNASQSRNATENRGNEHQSYQRQNSVSTASNPSFRDDDTATSIIYSSDSEPADVVEEEIVTEDEGDSNSDSDDGTMMTVVTEELTGTSVGTDRSDASNDSDEVDNSEGSTLEEALRLAAQRAGTQRLGEDEETMENDSEAEEVIPSFGWIKKSNQGPPAAPAHPAASAPTDDPTMHTEDGTNMDMEMDVTSAIGGIIRTEKTQSPTKDADEDMSMEVTRVLGGIIGQRQAQTALESDAEQDEPLMDEGTMDLTTAIGGIRSSQNNNTSTGLDSDGNEDMSMELTMIMGGVLAKQNRKSIGQKRQSVMGQVIDEEDATMDMTTGVGKIITEDESPEDDNDADSTFGMDMTAAIGGIISNKAPLEVTRDGSKPDEASASSPLRTSPRRRASLRNASGPPQSVAQPVQNDGPDLWAFQGNSLRRSVGPPSAMQTVDTSRTPSPEKPSTPQATSVSSPQKSTSQPLRRSTRSASRSASKSLSPEKANSSPRKTKTPSPAKASSAKRPQRKSLTSEQNAAPDDSSPLLGLTPQPQRTLTGVGADRTGLGSPRVAALFDRRESLGDSATDFVPGKRLVSFQDPKKQSEEIDRARAEAQSQEDREATFNLREMIDSLSPQRNPLKGRKSLHVGSAAGLLGKRPAELSDADDDDDAEEQDGVKRLKGHQGSPVKNVRLKQPPSKFETTGGLLRSSQQLFDTSGDVGSPKPASPVKNGQREMRRPLTRFAVDDTTTRNLDLDDSPTETGERLNGMSDDGRIHLQDFLKMTSIRFMELTTTKRRHTAAPASFKDNTSAGGEDDMSLERCVVAGACTVPTLELYQHSCRELKKYISEGRRIIKEIESDTFEENPPLFQEYMTAQPDFKALMDNQFKNVKTHARLLSKAMWYEWRMKLQDGLKEGLVKIAEGMESDDKLLQKKQDLLNSVLPDLLSRHAALTEQCENLEQVARELAESDPDELQEAREELVDLDEDIEAKKQFIAQLRQQYDETDAEVQSLAARKGECLHDIQESEKIREECRGWTSSEIDAFKGRVEAIEREHGWSVTGISGSILSMTYMREIELVFDISSFQPNGVASRVDLWYIGNTKAGEDPARSTVEKEIFLQCIRDYVRALPQHDTPVPDMLRVVRDGWNMARLSATQISHLNLMFPTTTSRTSDSSIAVTSSVMLVPLETRVEITLNIRGRSASDGVEFAIAPEATVVYGEHFNITKVGEFLSTRLGNIVGAAEEGWSDIMVELKGKLIARGRKK